MERLQATKTVRYAGKQYSEGQEFDAPEKDARLLVAIKKAKALGSAANNKTDLPKTALPKQEAKKEEPEPVDEMAALRAEYQALIGRRPFPGWDEAELRSRMAEYRRTDMRASSGEYQTTAMEAEE